VVFLHSFHSSSLPILSFFLLFCHILFLSILVICRTLYRHLRARSYKFTDNGTFVRIRVESILVGV
jgi:hypothetical protein